MIKLGVNSVLFKAFPFRTGDKCGALLSYDENEDVKEECIEKAFATNMPSGYGRNQKYIICPQCKNKIVMWSTR